MEANDIKAQLIKKRKHERTVLDGYDNDIKSIKTQIADAKVNIHNAKTDLDKSTVKLDSLKIANHECDKEIKRASDSLTRSERQMITQRESLLGHVADIARIYEDSLAKPLNHMIAAYKDVAKTTTGPIIVNDMKELQSLVDSCTDSLLVMDGTDGKLITIRAKATDTINKPKKVVNDCSCNKTDLFETTYKVKEQITDSGKSIYHTIIQMPSKFIDFASLENPLKKNTLDAARAVVPILRWNTTGTISAKHKLNDTRESCKIVDLETGTAFVDLNPKSYEMGIKFDGDALNGHVVYTKRDQRTNDWIMEKGV